MTTSALAMEPRPANPVNRWRARCRSKTAMSWVTINAPSKSWCGWWGAAIPRPDSTRPNPTRPASTRLALDRRRRNSISWSFWSLAALLDELATFLHRAIGCPPGHDRYRGGGILRRAVDQSVRIDHVDQHVPLGVAAADDLHLLEEQRAALAEHIVALPHLVLEVDRADLPACQRDIRDLLGQAQPALHAPLFRHRKVTGHPVDLGVVDAIGRELVVGAQPFEHGRAAENQVRLVGGRGRASLPERQGQHRQSQISVSFVTLTNGLGCHESLR